jgi:hypothetical protein
MAPNNIALGLLIVEQFGSFYHATGTEIGTSDSIFYYLLFECPILQILAAIKIHIWSPFSAAVFPNHVPSVIDFQKSWCMCLYRVAIAG